MCASKEDHNTSTHRCVWICRKKNLPILCSRRNLLFDRIDVLPGLLGGMHLFLYLSVSADDCGVVLSVDEIGDRQQRVIGHLSAEIHCNLTRIHIPGLSLLAADLRWCQMKMFRHGIDNHLGVKTAALLRRNKIFKGDTLHVLTPKGYPEPITAEEIFDENGDPIDSTPHAEMTYLLKVAKPLPAYSFLSRDGDKDEGIFKSGEQPSQTKP